MPLVEIDADVYEVLKKLAETQGLSVSEYIKLSSTPTPYAL